MRISDSESSVKEGTGFPGISNSFVLILKVRQDPLVSSNSLNPLNIEADLLISINPGVVLKVEISKHTKLQLE